MQEAIRRVQMTGTVIRSQAPLVNHVNADAEAWATMWRAQARLGVVPYYMFVERDTGAKHYFEVRKKGTVTYVMLIKCTASKHNKM